MKKFLTLTGTALLTATTFAVAAQAGPSSSELVKGKAQYARCQSCHALDPEVQRGIGPNLAGIVGKKAGQQAGFRYSRGLAKANFRWTPAKLDEFLAKPRNVVPGTTMVFAGMPDAKSRKALIAYLSNSKN